MVGTMIPSSAAAREAIPPVVVITGASRGIGAATARRLAATNALCLAYRTDEVAAQRVLDECRALGARAITVQTDVAVEADVVRLFERAENELGAIGGLVNNAGVVDVAQPVADMAWARWHRRRSSGSSGSSAPARGSGGVSCRRSRASSSSPSRSSSPTPVPPRDSSAAARSSARPRW